MPTIESVSFNTDDWTLREETTDKKVWVLPDYRELLFLHLFDLRPDLPYDLSQLDKLRAQYSGNLPPQPELVEMDVDEYQGVKALRQIFKFILNPDGRGRGYLASFTFPFQTFSFVIKVQCQEIGTTGQRESYALNKLMGEGLLDMNTLIPGKDGVSHFPPEMVRLISTTTDKEELDAQFPNHPLSRARQHLRKIGASIKFDKSVLDAESFSIDSQDQSD